MIDLLILAEGNRHCIWIKDMVVLCYCNSQHHGHKYSCHFCLLNFCVARTPKTTKALEVSLNKPR